MQLYAIHNTTTGEWWCQGYPSRNRHEAYLWRDPKLARKKFKHIEEFYGWRQQGHNVELVLFRVSEMGRLQA